MFVETARSRELGAGSVWCMLCTLERRLLGPGLGLSPDWSADGSAVTALAAKLPLTLRPLLWRQGCSLSSCLLIVSSVRSSSVHHGLIEIQQQQQGHFFRFFKIGAILPIYIHHLLSLSLSVHYTEQNQAILLHELHRMHVLSSRFYKVLQISLRPNICYIF